MDCFKIDMYATRNDRRLQMIHKIDLNTTRNDPQMFSHSTRNDPRGIIGMEWDDVYHFGSRVKKGGDHLGSGIISGRVQIWELSLTGTEFAGSWPESCILTCTCFDLFLLFCLFPGLLKIGLRTAFAHISQLVEQYYECIQG